MGKKGLHRYISWAGLLLVLATGAARAASGLQWTEVSPPTGSRLTQVIYAGGRYIAVGTSTIMESTDGVNWTVVYQPMQGFGVQTVAYGNGVYVAGGSISKDDGSDQDITVRTGTWATSRDGVHWTPTRFSSAPGSEIVFANSQFTMIGTTCGENTGVQIQPDEYFPCIPSGVDISGDGKVWITNAPAAGIPSLPKSIVFSDGQFLSVIRADTFHDTVYASSDAATWAPTSTFVSTGEFTEFRVTGDTVSAVGSDGVHPVVAISEDGENWTATTFDFTAEQGARIHGAFMDIVRYGDSYLAAFKGEALGAAQPKNQDQLVMSPDGKNWCFLGNFPSDDHAVSLAIDGGQVVTVGDDGAIFSTPVSANPDTSLSCGNEAFVGIMTTSVPTNTGGKGCFDLLILTALFGMMGLRRRGGARRPA